MAEDTKEQMVEILNRAWPLGGDYVTRTELATAMHHVEEKLQSSQTELSLKIKHSEMTQRTWILSGIIATILAFGGGYVSLVSKLDRITENLPEITQTLEERRVWGGRQDQRDDRQDRSLEHLDPKYEGMPYTPQPR